MENIQYFVHYDNVTNDLLGYYTTDRFKVEDIPTPNQEVTFEEWQAAITLGANALINGSLEYVEPVLPAEERDAINRKWRDRELVLTDPYMLSDRPLEPGQKAQVIQYRQALRDYPDDWIRPDRPSFLD